MGQLVAAAVADEAAVVDGTVPAGRQQKALQPGKRGFDQGSAAVAAVVEQLAFGSRTQCRGFEHCPVCRQVLL